MRRQLLSFISILYSLLTIWFLWMSTDLIVFGLSAKPQYQKLAWLLLSIPYLCMAGLPIIYWQRRHRSSKGSLERLSILSYLGLGILSVVFAFVLLREIAALGSFIFQFFLPGIFWVKALYSAPVTLAIVAAGFSVFIFGLIETIRLPRVKQVAIAHSSLPANLSGFKIVQLSDLHIGPRIKHQFVKEVVKRVNALNPDVIALTGDIFDGSPDDLEFDVAPLQDLKAKHGTYYVTGNHEYYSGGGATWAKKIEALGHTALLNTFKVLKIGDSAVLVAGVPDVSAGRFDEGHRSDPKRACAGAPDTHFKMLLAHQPVSAHAALEAKYDLQLSGHTHGGQFIPWTFFIRFFHKFWRGLGRYESMWVYVSCGTGTWGPPLRIGAPSEITEIILSAG